jgi:hypothetical protein
MQGSEAANRRASAEQAGRKPEGANGRARTRAGTESGGGDGGRRERTDTQSKKGKKKKQIKKGKKENKKNARIVGQKSQSQSEARA